VSGTIVAINSKKKWQLAEHLTQLGIDGGSAMEMRIFGRTATRFAISQPAIGTILVGIAAPHQFENALAAVEKGPLPPAALDRLSTLLQTFSGEPR
jgi:aryl-alcohol dehydrogenase-like predicted oxidoreductase